MSNSNSFKKIIALLSVIVLVLLCAQYFLYVEISTKNKKISEMVNSLDLQENRQDYLISMQNMLNSMSSNVEAINSSVVSSDADVQFIEYLESLAKENRVNLKIDNLSFEDSAILKDSNVTNFKIKANTSGPWSGTYAFISKLESMQYKVKINKFSAVSQTTDLGDQVTKSTGEWKSNFEMVVLKYK
ncbi:MAG: hypothetical protein AB201_02635 [Parcubacteria bacterium C7867-006]|nr:MAG: hypothetical protein AB201_02635 [Parcubacteria bacterium C7867-006]